MKTSPQRSSVSPARVKDYFSNPLHKIKQPAFVEIGFNNSTLSTFVKAFTNKTNTKYLSYPKIRTFIANFTKNNPGVYQQFFNKNFNTQNNTLIQIDSFMEFFTKQDHHELPNLSEKQLKRVFEDLQPLNKKTLAEKSYELGLNISEQQAQRIIKLVNYGVNNTSEEEIKLKTFNSVMLNKK